MEEQLIAVATIIGFPVFFAVMWCAACWIIAHLGGWSELATRYQTDAKPPPNARFTSGRVGALANYNGVLRLGGDEQGLHLSVMAPFRFGHPSLQIPWELVHETGEALSFFGRRIRVDVAGVSVIVFEHAFRQAETGRV